VEGLGPVKVAALISRFSDYDSAIVNDGFAPPRTITVTVGINPTYEFGGQSNDMREMLYSYLLGFRQVELHFDTDHMPPVKILGHLELMDPKLFAETNDITFSVVCADPYFQAVTPIVYDVAANGTILGNVTTFDVDYEGDVPVGFILVPDPGPSTSVFYNWTMTLQEDPDRSMTFTGQIIREDYVWYLDTRTGSKKFEFGPSSDPDQREATSFLFGEWLYLDPEVDVLYDVNTFVWTKSAASAAQLATMTYTPKYVGL